jgi:hypothetical protein
MRCPICGERVKNGGGNNHHIYFPRKHYVGTEFEELTVRVHVFCHRQLHSHFLRNCMNPHNRRCDNCRYTGICCYKI